MRNFQDTFFNFHNCTFNNNLNFDYHVNQLYKIASKKLHALASAWALFSEECS